jgi:hypothetical protein
VCIFLFANLSKNNKLIIAYLGVLAAILCWKNGDKGIISVIW